MYNFMYCIKNNMIICSNSYIYKQKTVLKYMTEIIYTNLASEMSHPILLILMRYSVHQCTYSLCSIHLHHLLL